MNFQYRVLEHIQLYIQGIIFRRLLRDKYIRVSIFSGLSRIRLSDDNFAIAGVSGYTDEYFHFAAKCVSVLLQLATSFCRKIHPVFCRKMNSCFAAI